MACCCQTVICNCATSANVPAALFLSFRNFSFTYLTSTSGAITGAESFIADYVNSITAELTLKTSIVSGVTSVVYSTGGCTTTPCAGCSPDFVSRATYDTLGPQDSLRVDLRCGVIGFPIGVFITGEAEFSFFTPPGCQPSVPSGGATPSSFVASFRLPTSSSVANLCSVVGGNSFDVPILPSSRRFLGPVVGEWRTPSGTGYYSGSGGTITCSLNSLP
jgi:hypothetical protein